MKKILFPMLMLLAVIAVSNAFSTEEPAGKPVIEINGGNKGDITFPHQTHQQALKDCSVCHTLFPKQPGVVKAMKDEGKLQKKQVMNHCLDCHRNMKAKNEKTGPTSCSKCHG